MWYLTNSLTPSVSIPTTEASTEVASSTPSLIASSSTTLPAPHSIGPSGGRSIWPSSSLSPSITPPPSDSGSDFVVDPFALTLSVFYGVVMLVISAQIARILYNRHNVRSFQFSFLAINFLWALLRMVFWILAEAPQASDWGMIILYWIPFNLQYATFCLLVLFFASMIHKKWQKYRRIYFGVFYGASLLLLTMTTIWYWIFEVFAPDNPNEDISQYIDFFLWVCLVVAIFYYTIRLAVKSWKFGVPGPLQVQGIKLNVLLVLSIVISLIFLVRSILNLLASILGPLQSLRIYHDKHDLDWVGFVVFALWDITPTLMVLFLFRNIPTVATGASMSKIPASFSNLNSKTLFENPHRYDSDNEEDGEDEEHLLAQPPPMLQPFESPFAMRFDGSFHMPGGYRMNSLGS